MRFLKTIWFWISAPFRWLRVKVIKWLLRKRAKLQMGTLRYAIHDADDNKEKTGRKNEVLFNSHSGEWEAIQKKVLKRAAEVGKNKSNKSMTPGRKWAMSKEKRKKRVLDYDRVRQLEEKSLYVTK